MDNRFIRLFLSAVVLAMGTTGAVFAEEQSILEDPPVIDPNVVRLGLKDADIDDENFEVGAFIGFMSVEHFGTHEVYGIRGAWHVNEDLFFEANYGMTSVDQTPAEYAAGDFNLFTDDDRDFIYYNLSLGFNILPGEVFMTSDWAFNSSFYLLAGGGTVDFLGEKEFALNIGMGLRVVATDSLALHLTFQDIMTDKLKQLSDGSDGSAHNMQYSASLTYFF
ncbi:outer membrane beta-barrel domain-containing protein [Ketobacter sp.]|uniref:outer membrane beta-barrel domain-containing protein n=1 Tax=Ketobacter sp. TaxID=2083498 RepID=UPI000F2AFE53|nr:outer membrane beta-barrel domain-containing protein [Ketobacter sp.]MEE2729516.1 outer membrane beta-barrel domain-containing protein [Pseudomonadota bacterium]RLU01047.1 MAG: outer membrane beta-barrel domain-containing protein [Ketobacter sp.]